MKICYHTIRDYAGQPGDSTMPITCVFNGTPKAWAKKKAELKKIGLSVLEHKNHTDRPGDLTEWD